MFCRTSCKPAPDAATGSSCRGLRMWPHFERDIERQFAYSMLPYRRRAHVIYSIFFLAFMATKTVQSVGKPSFIVQLCLLLAFVLFYSPLLGCCAGQLRGLAAVVSLCKRPWVHCIMGIGQLVLFLVSLLLYTSQTTDTTITYHLSLLWLMTIIGTSGVFDFWCFVVMLVVMNVLLFYFHPQLDNSLLYALCVVIPPLPLAQARPCLSTGWALNHCFSEFSGPLFLWSQM